MLKDNRRSLAVIVAICMILVFCFTACAGEKQPDNDTAGDIIASQPANYQTAQVQMGDFKETTVGTASATYVGAKNLIWEGSSAYYQEALVKTRESVKKGDPLITLQIEENEIELESLKLQLRRQKENFEKEKVEKLAAIATENSKAESLGSYEKQISLLTVEKLQVEYERFLFQTGKTIAQLEERIATMEQERENNVLVAPFDGIISRIDDYSTGDKIVPGTVLLMITPTDNIMVNARKGTETLRYNMPVTVETGDTNSKKFTGRVVVAPNILPEGVSQTAVLIKLDEDVGREYLTGSLKVHSVKQEINNVLVVDRDAINTKDGESYVSILDGVMIQKRYVVAKKNAAEMAWILEGLTEGQTLLIE